MDPLHLEASGQTRTIKTARCPIWSVQDVVEALVVAEVRGLEQEEYEGGGGKGKARPSLGRSRRLHLLAVWAPTLFYSTLLYSRLYSSHCDWSSPMINLNPSAPSLFAGVGLSRNDGRPLFQLECVTGTVLPLHQQLLPAPTMRNRSEQSSGTSRPELGSSRPHKMFSR